MINAEETAKKVTWIYQCSKDDVIGYGPYTVIARSNGWFYGVKNIKAGNFWPCSLGDLSVEALKARCKDNIEIMLRTKDGRI